jgi:hypothetical protein
LALAVPLFKEIIKEVCKDQILFLVLLHQLVEAEAGQAEMLLQTVVVLVEVDRMEVTLEHQGQAVKDTLVVMDLAQGLLHILLVVAAALVLLVEIQLQQ